MEKERTFCEGYSSCLDAVRSKTSEKIEYGFYRYGVFAGRHPFWVAGFSLFLCAVAGTGLRQWRGGLSDLELYMPVDSPVRTAANWVAVNFPEEFRYETIIVEADNVLRPDVLAVISELENDVRGISAEGSSWTDVCAKYTTWFKRNSSISNIDIPPQLRDTLQKEGLMQDKCLSQSPLGAFPDGTPFRNTSQENILDVINKSARSKKNIFSDVRPFLSQVERNSTNHIISAKAALIIYFLEELISKPAALAWERKFIEIMMEKNKTAPPGIKIYAIAKRSYYDILEDVMNSNMTIMGAGYSLVIIYIIFMLGRFDRLNQRIYLSILGVSIAGQSLLASHGLCFYLGFFDGPVHRILPFLLLGVGVDNMFIIVDCLGNIKKTYKNLSVPERIGEGLKSSGISITVTSFTNLLAFGIGSTTKMPFLRSFCIFAASGIFFLWFFQLLFFVSVLALDEYRIDAQRDGCFYVKLTKWKQSAFLEKHSLHTCFRDYVGTPLMRKPAKVIVLITTGVILAVNSYGLFKIQRHFDPIWYIDAKSYPMLFYGKLNEYFPSFGTRAGVYIGDLSYYNDTDKLDILVSHLASNKYINQGTTKIWFAEFSAWMHKKRNIPESDEEYKAYLTEFLLFTRTGQGFIKDIKFSTFPFKDYNITGSKIRLQFVMLNTTEQKLDVVRSIDAMIAAMNLTGNQKVVSFSPDYVPWYTDEIIGKELTRNIALTFAAVTIVTLLMVQELQTTMWVLICVIFTLVDLVGSMFYLGLTIEISSSILVLICAGLSVDYAAHIGYQFYKATGSGDERAISTLGHMGPAIFNGGFSTFLAFALLGFSDAHIFNTFFKLFTSVVIYGLFNGMIFLPVILSLVEPTEKLLSHEKYTTTAPAKDLVNETYVPTRTCLDPNGHQTNDCENLRRENLLSQPAVSHSESLQNVETVQEPEKPSSISTNSKTLGY